MYNKYENIILNFDLLGQVPQLRIFKNNNYKSKINSILSIIIILLSAAFIIYSFIDFFQYKNPSIIYSKSNDKTTERAILLEDTLLMISIDDTKNTPQNELNVFLDAKYSYEHSDKGKFMADLTIDKCAFGKNINIKFKNNFKNENVEDYYCLSSNNKNLSLFFIPDKGKASIYLYMRINEDNNFNFNNLVLSIINNNDIMEHNNKNNPISNSDLTFSYSIINPSKFSFINYYLQYINYESDTGLLFPNSKIFNAKTYSHMTIKETNYDEEMDKKLIGIIAIELSENNFDYYKRVYPRFQSLLAEIMSVINLLFFIGKTLFKLLLNKKMSIDIVKHIINNITFANKKEDLNQNIKIINYEKYPENSIEIKNIEINKSVDKSQVINFKGKEVNSEIEPELVQIEQIKNSNNKIFENLNSSYIFRSYFCCYKKDRRIQLINLCHDIVSKELCIEDILFRLYELENKIKYIINKGINKPNYYKNNEIEVLNNIIKDAEQKHIK